MMPGLLKEEDQQKDLHLLNGPVPFKLGFVVQRISRNKFFILGFNHSKEFLPKIDESEILFEAQVQNLDKKTCVAEKIFVCP